MTELVICEGIVIDDVYCALSEIRKLSGKYVSDLSVVKRFVTEEINTKFYFDNKMKNSTQPSRDAVYLWIDTGFTDNNGKAIFISLLQSYGQFIGHITGTAATLAQSAKGYFKQNRSTIEKNIQNFRNKYESKIADRIVKHIEDENAYIIQSANRTVDNAPSPLAQMIDSLGFEFNEVETEIVVVEEPAKVDPMAEFRFNQMEEEITIGLLLEKMDSMQSYMEELLCVIEKMEAKDQAEIADLRKKNEEYKQAMVQMRTFMQEEDAELEARREDDNCSGHALLGNHNKILVIGGEELGVNIMQGIAKTYGFEKKDFEFVDYAKAKDYTDRIRRDGKYSAVIFGACPHKISAGAGYSSAIEKFKQLEGMPYTTDARTQSGELKLTRESFRAALLGVYDYLRMVA